MKKLRKTLALICALTLVQSTTVIPLGISAADEATVVSSTEESDPLVWHKQTQLTGRMNCDYSDGKYNICIVNPGGVNNGGEDRWDCQFSRSGLDIKKGHIYTVSYQITSDTDGKYYTRIANNDRITVGESLAGEVWHSNGMVRTESSDGTVTEKEVTYSDGWNLSSIKAGETLKISATFEATDSIDDAEWCFDLGGNGKYTVKECFPKGTNLTFENMSVVDNSAGKEDDPIQDNPTILDSSDFDDGIGLPWRINTSGTGNLNFDITGGKFNVEIINPGGYNNNGDDRWDCELKRKGLSIEEGHTYTLSYEITSDTAGHYYSYIGNIDHVDEGGYDAGEAWHNNGKIKIESSDGTVTEKEVNYRQGWELQDIKAGETRKVTATFTATGSIKDAQWIFAFGGQGQYTPVDCFPKGTKLSFDNMSLKDLTGTELPVINEYQKKHISVNQLGYITNCRKQAVFANPSQEISEDTAVDFNITKDGKTVYTGTSSKLIADQDNSGNSVYVLDFSDFNTPGTGYKIAVGDIQSSEFDIGSGSDLYSDLLDDSLNYFYQSRSGSEVDEKYITAKKYDSQLDSAKDSGIDTQLTKSALAHDALNLNDKSAYVQPQWYYYYNLDGSDVVISQPQDVSGGWNDYDNTKDVVCGSISAWTLMNMYERKLADNKSDLKMSIPENENEIPDILDEVKNETDFLLKMRVQDGEKKGMFYSSVCDCYWTGFAPTKETEESVLRIVKPTTTQATLDAAAVLAQFARLYRQYDPEYAETCLNAAKDAYAAALIFDGDAKVSDYGSSGPYVDPGVANKNDKYWAACELWLTAGDDNYTYSDDIHTSDYYLSCPQIKDGISGVFDEDEIQALGSLSLAANKDKLKDEEWTKLKSNIIGSADSVITAQEKQGYGAPITKQDIVYRNNDGRSQIVNGYPEGSNAYVLRNSLVIATAYDITGKNVYADSALSGMDYILGRNPNEISYVTGYGTYHTTFVCHKYWAAQVNKNYPVAPSGVLAGGPASYVKDYYSVAAGYTTGKYPAQASYIDNIDAYSFNYNQTNWNAALAWMSDFASEVSVDERAPLAYGNLNGAEGADLSDMTLLSQYLMGDVKLDYLQIKSADVNGDGDVNIADLAHFKQYIMEEEVILGPQTDIQ